MSIHIQQSSSTSQIAAGLMSVLLISSGSCTPTQKDYSTVYEQEFGNKKELLHRFSEGRSGDFQWKVAEYVSAPKDIINPSTMVNVILGSMGLGMTDLEKVLRVKRATIYNWRNGGEIRAEDSLERLRAVYFVAKDIAEFNDRPFGKRAKTHQIDGKSYLDLLSDDHLDIKAITASAKVLSKQEVARVKAKDGVSQATNDIDNFSGGWQQV